MGYDGGIRGLRITGASGAADEKKAAASPGPPQDSQWSPVPKISSLKQDVTVQLQLDVDGSRSVVLSLFKNARNSGHCLQSFSLPVYKA